MTAEPSGRYVGHVTPEEPVHPVKPAMKEAEAVYHLMQQHDLTESSMMLGGDSTVSNTGWKRGAIAKLEKLKVISVIGVFVCYTQMNCHFSILF